MNIKLIRTHVDELSLLKNEGKMESIEFSFSTAFSEKQKNSFLIIFNLKLRINDESILTVSYFSEFEADQDIGFDDQESKFFSINAPAIAYPFLRAYIANFTLSSGFDPVMLPTINFVNHEKSRVNS